MIDILQKAAHEAGKVLLRYYQKSFSTTIKTSHQDIVTDADLESQKIIYQTIIKEMTAKGYPKEEIGFIGEEKLKRKGKYLFIIDPLDGTNNFAAGFEYFGVSIACVVDKQIVAAIIHFPVHHLSYIAEKGKGAFKLENGQRKKMNTGYQPLDQSLAATHISIRESLRKNHFQILEDLSPHVRAVRILGSIVLSLGLLCENSLHFYFESNAYIWDIAAAKLIVEESGGIMIDWKGKKINFDFKSPDKFYQVIICHPKMLEKVRKFFPFV